MLVAVKLRQRNNHGVLLAHVPDSWLRLHGHHAGNWWHHDEVVKVGVAVGVQRLVGRIVCHRRELQHDQQAGAAPHAAGATATATAAATAGAAGDQGRGRR